MADQPQPLQALPGLEPLPGTQGNPPDQPPARAGFGGARPIPGLEPLPGTQGANIQDALRPLPEAGLTPLPGTEAKPESQGPWYSRAWDAANTPLTTTLFGWGSHREGATGFEKGLEDFASGFTSPLSVALLVGTLGSSAAFEAGGSAALRAAGMGAEEIAQATRGTEIISKAVQAGKNSAQALQAAGISPNVMSKAVTALRAAGLSSENMATHGLFGGGMSSGLRAMGLGIADAEKVGKGVQLAVDLGFKAQGAYQAVQESPRLLDALKDGDYETAKELFVHVLGGGAQAVLGGGKFLKDAGSSIDDLGEKFGLKVKMSVENQKLRDNYGTYQADKTQAQRTGKIISDDLRAKYDKLTPADREGVFYLMQANGSRELIAKRLNMLAEAAGRDDAKVPEIADPPALGPEQLPVMKIFHGTDATGPNDITNLDGGKFGKAQGVGGIGTYVSDDPETASKYVGQKEGAKVIAGVLRPNMHMLDATKPMPMDITRTLADAFTRIAKQAAPDEDPAAAFGRYSAETAASQGKPFAPKALNDPSLTYVEMIDATRRMLADSGQDVRKGLVKLQSAVAREGYDGVNNIYTDRPVHMLFPKEVTGHGIEEFVKPATPTKALSADEAKVWNNNGEAAEIERQLRYRQLATEQRLAGTKNYSPKEIDQLLDAYKRAYNATPEMHGLSQELGKRFAESLEKAQQKDVIKQGVLDYVTQIWGKDQDHPAANTLVHDANNGAFQTNVSMARHRMFDSAFEGQLLGRKLQVTDPITLVGNHISKVGSAIAARDFMERLVDKGVRTSDGRPMVALAGHGQLVEGEEGENPAVLANPDRIRNIKIAAERVNKLEKSGDLDRLIEEGKIVAYPATPESVIKGQGLVYKGELTPGSGVHQFEHPQYPGKTAAIGGRNITSGSVSDKLASTLGGFGITAPKLPGTKDEHYFWNTHDYQTINHSAFHDWNFGAQAPDGTPTMIKSELRVHPEAYKYLKQLIGDEPPRSEIKQVLLRTGSEAKHLTLSLSPFHIWQEGWRALMTGVNPLGIEKWDLRNDPSLYRLVRAGMTLGKDNASLQDFAEGNVASGHSAILSKIPLVRDVQNWMQSFLFDKYIPGLKVRAGKALYERYMNAAQDSQGNFKEGWDAERVARTTASDTNERFGGINYKQLGRSAGAQDFLRLTALAPDWLESEMRSAQRAMTPGVEGTVARRDLVRMAAGLWVAARILNYVTSGQPHNEAPFGVSLKDKDGHEKVYGFRNLPQDLLHMMQDPVDFLRGRASPLLKFGTEALTGRDRMGRKLTPFQQVVDVTRGNLPIPVQLIGQAAEGQLPSGLTNVDQAVKASGFTVQPYRTEAQKLAINLASNRSEGGPVDSSQLGRHQAKIEFEDRLRSGQMKPEEVHQMVEDGHLSVKEGKEIIKNAGETAGMDADQAALYSRSLHLPMKDFLQVWDAATPNEKAVLSKLMVKKKISFFKSAHNNMAPEERKADPTYRRLRSMFPNEAPW